MTPPYGSCIALRLHLIREVLVFDHTKMVECDDDVIKPPVPHKVEVLSLSLVNKVQPHANMGNGLVKYVSCSP